MSELNKEKKDIPILEYTILGGVAVIFLLFIFQMKAADINLARSVFSGLISGSYGVEKQIDWEHLHGLDVNAGQTYSRFNTQQEKAGYKKAFIQGFSLGFKQVRGDARSFINWRIYSKDKHQVIVAADYQGRNKTLLLTLAGAGRKKLSSIQWKGVDEKK